MLRDPAYGTGAWEVSIEKVKVTVMLPTIVEVEVWHAVQAGLIERDSFVGRPRFRYNALLSESRGRCGECGGMLVAKSHVNTRQKALRYRCRNHCGQNIHHDVDAVDEVVWSQFTRMLGSPDLLQEAADAPGNMDTGLDAERERLDKLLAKQIKAESATFRMLDDGIIDADGFSRRMKELTSQRQETSRRLEEVTQALGQQQAALRRLDEVGEELDRLRDRIEGADAETKITLLKLLVPKGTGGIYVFADGRIAIRGVLSLSSSGLGGGGGPRNGAKDQRR